MTGECKDFQPKKILNYLLLTCIYPRGLEHVSFNRIFTLNMIRKNIENDQLQKSERK